MRRLILRFYDQLYTNLAWAYDLATWVGSGGLWYQWVSVAARYVVAEPVLDVGFGRGRLLEQLAREGHTVIGVDRSREMVRAGQRRLRRAKLTGKVIQGEAQALALPDASVGTLITTFPTSYLRDPATLREFARVLQPCGHWVWVDSPFARKRTLRMTGLSIMARLARVGRSMSGSSRPFEAAVGPLFPQVTVETVPVGPTGVHVVLASKGGDESTPPG